MRLFVGLGNPGAKHSGNRHNIGYMAADRIAADHGFSPWRTKFQGRVAEGRLGSTKALLLKPETFMNLSGQSVGEAARFFRIPAEDVTVLHDELDLAPGKCRFKRGGGHAGHNGLRSIHAHIGADYCRIRLGIGRPERKEQVMRFVLGDFAGADREWLEDLLRGVSEGAPKLAAGDPERFMNAVSLRVAPPRSSAAPGRPRKPSEAPSGAPGPEQRRKAERERTEEPERFGSALRRLAERFR